MKRELYIQVPEPCHEDWNKMTPVQQGRYCQSCCKEVVDFSLMTDQEIMNFLSKPRGKTCGNFASDQLNRIIREPATSSKKKAWAVMLSFLFPFFVSSKIKAQFRPRRSVDTVKTQNGTPRIVLGKMAVRPKSVKSEVATLKGDTVAIIQYKSFTVQGIVKDSSGLVIPGATVMIKGTQIGVAANEKGEYSIVVSNKKEAIIQVSAVGFISQEFNVNSDTTNANIILHQQQITLPDVVVATRNDAYLTGIAGGISIVVQHKDIPKLIVDTVVNLIKPSLIKVYPNPASKSGFVNVQLSKVGSYQLKLIDNDGKLIQQNSFTIFAKRQAYQLELPSTIATGIYYIDVIDEKSKKQYTQKLIIQ